MCVVFEWSAKSFRGSACRGTYPYTGAVLRYGRNTIFWLLQLQLNQSLENTFLGMSNLYICNDLGQNLANSESCLIAIKGQNHWFVQK